MDLPSSTRGSAKIKYTPTLHADALTGSQVSMITITAMQEYKKVSMEELRNEDYLASGGLFGSNIAKVGVALCAEPIFKQSPDALGKLYRSVIADSPVKTSDKNRSEAKENGNKREKKSTMRMPQSNESTERTSETKATLSNHIVPPSLRNFPRMTFFEAFTDDIDRMTDRSFTELKYLFSKMVFELSEKDNEKVTNCL